MTESNLLVFLVVDVLVLAHPLEIVEGLLCDTDRQHEHERRHISKHEACPSTRYLGSK